MLFLGLLIWFLIGLSLGFVINKAVNLRGDDPRLGMIAAASGAMLLGLTIAMFSETGISARNLWAHVGAATGAVVAATIWHAWRSRSSSRTPPSFRRSY